MKSQSGRRLLMHYEAAEMLNLTPKDIQWLVDTRQIHEVVIHGKKRLDKRDVDRLVTFYRRVQQRSKNYAEQSVQVSGR